MSEETSIGFGFGQKAECFYEQFKGSYVRIHTTKSAFLAKLADLNDDSFIFHPLERQETQYGPRMVLSKKRSIISRGLVGAIDDLTQSEFKAIRNQSYHGPLAPFSGKLVELRTNGDGIVGKLVYVNHTAPEKFAKLCPYLTMVPDEKGALSPQFVDDSEFLIHYKEPRIRVVSEQELQGEINRMQAAADKANASRDLDHSKIALDKITLEIQLLSAKKQLEELKEKKE